MSYSIFRNGGISALRSIITSDNEYRIQIDGDGKVRLYHTTNGGTNWISDILTLKSDFVVKKYVNVTTDDAGTAIFELPGYIPIGSYFEDYRYGAFTGNNVLRVLIITSDNFRLAINTNVGVVYVLFAKL